MNAEYFRWIAECCKLLGITASKDKESIINQKVYMANDDNWFYAYKDGLTPKEAVRKYKEFLKDV